MPTKSIIHESVAGVLKSVGVKPRGTGIQAANHRALLRESDSDAVIGDKAGGVVVKMQSHPKLSNCSWTVANIAEAKTQAFNTCRKAGGFPIFEDSKEGELNVRFIRDAAKATVKDAATLATHLKEAKSEAEEDETDGTGEPSGDTGTNTGASNKPVGTKKGVQADNKGEENSKDVAEAVADEKGEKHELFNKEKLGKYKDLIAKKKMLAAKKDKTPAEKTEESEIDAQLDQLCESFYHSLPHGVTFVLYNEGIAEVHGLTEEELAPFAGTPPAVPCRYAKEAKGAGPNSKVDMGVLSIYKTENMDVQSQKILTGKDFKAQGWGTPGKGTGKQGKWSDSGKMPLDSKKDLKAGFEK